MPLWGNAPAERWPLCYLKALFGAWDPHCTAEPLISSSEAGTTVLAPMRLLGSGLLTSHLQTTHLWALKRLHLGGKALKASCKLLWRCFRPILYLTERGKGENKTKTHQWL